MINSNRSFLYLIVSDYPYGFGEPFLEDELAVIASSFEKIYLIIPEPFKADTPFIPSLVLPFVNASFIAHCRVSFNIILI